MEYYAQVLLDEAAHPQGWSEWETHPSECCHNASCGDTMAVRARIENGKIVEVEWHGEGCTLSRAAASLVSQYVAGSAVTEVQNIDLEKVKKIIGINQISPGRVKCVLLFVQCLQRQLAPQTESKERAT